MGSVEPPSSCGLTMTRETRNKPAQFIDKSVEPMWPEMEHNDCDIDSECANVRPRCPSILWAVVVKH